MKRLAPLALCLFATAGARAAAPAAHASISSSPSGELSYSGAELAVDLFADFVSLAAEVALLDQVMSAPAPEERPLEARGGVVAQRDDGYNDPPPNWRVQRRQRRRDAREGFLFSFGLGGAGLHVSPERGVGAFDFDLRMGYGFSDRFQLYGDLAVDSGQYTDGTSITSWMLTARGQTVLIGDRDGNGLNLNAGFGLGGTSRTVCGGYCDYGYGYGYGESHSAAGVAAGAGLSYDARLGHSFRLSPEFFVNWHQVPNDNGRAADIATAIGFRLNFLWYVQ